MNRDQIVPRQSLLATHDQRGAGWNTLGSKREGDAEAPPLHAGEDIH